jgi:hypothetical protein
VWESRGRKRIVTSWPQQKVRQVYRGVSVMLRKTQFIASLALAAGLLGGFPVAAQAADKEPPVTLTKCDKAIGSVALVDGDTQGWTKYGLSSPRELIAAMARESGCFTLHDPASGKPATFLMNVIAGDKEEVDKSIETAKGVAMEGLVRSGAASGLMRGLPGGGAVLGMFGGFGGKRQEEGRGRRYPPDQPCQRADRGIGFGRGEEDLDLVRKRWWHHRCGGQWRDGCGLCREQGRPDADRGFRQGVQRRGRARSGAGIDGSGHRCCPRCIGFCGHRHRHEDVCFCRYQVCNAPHRARRNRSHPHRSAHGSFDRGQRQLRHKRLGLC